ncbi:MAG: ABC transporter ATP-binding protein [Pseudomonadaceae bacterium]|nr:ABC transporter ATP-binding protein [Pseudomonadaceae bacterium]
MSVLAASHLQKRYGDTVALDGLNMTVEAGQIVGLIGPNGCGKTTALKSFMGLCRVDSGELSLLSQDPFETRAELMRRVTYIADVGTLPRWMRVHDLIDYVSSVNPRFDREAAMQTLAVTQIKQKSRISALSKGMTVQLHLALVLASNAELLVLDEPTLGLDLLYRQRFYDSVLNDYFEQERSIVITTHEVREIENILTHVVFMNRGKAVLSAAMDELPGRFSKVLAQPERLDDIKSLNPLSLRPTLKGIAAIFDGQQANQLTDIGEVTTPNLSELFVAVVGGES